VSYSWTQHWPICWPLWKANNRERLTGWSVCKDVPAAGARGARVCGGAARRRAGRPGSPGRHHAVAGACDAAPLCAARSAAPATPRSLCFLLLNTVKITIQIELVVRILPYCARGGAFDPRTVQTFACMKIYICIRSGCFLYIICMYIQRKLYEYVLLSLI
jgi:hypothetical protein